MEGGEFLILLPPTHYPLLTTHYNLFIWRGLHQGLGVAVGYVLVAALFARNGSGVACIKMILTAMALQELASFGEPNAFSSGFMCFEFRFHTRYYNFDLGD